MHYIKNTDITNSQIYALTALRVIIGWHLLYEGLVKVVDPSWSAASYLAGSQGPFASVFHSMASNSNILEPIDFLNQWGLVAIGLSLMIGLFSRWASIGGIVLLFLYYISNPPFIGIANEMADGNYLIVNNNLVEIFALMILYLFPTEKLLGLERLFVCTRSAQVHPRI